MDIAAVPQSIARMFRRVFSSSQSETLPGLESDAYNVSIQPPQVPIMVADRRGDQLLETADRWQAGSASCKIKFYFFRSPVAQR